MKNNTKLIMETWRRFLKEGPEGIGADGMVLDPDVDVDSSLPAVEDSDLEGDIQHDLQLADQMNSDPFKDEYNPQGVGEIEGPENQLGGVTHEERVQSALNILMDDPTNDLPGFTEYEREEARVRLEEKMPSSMEDMHNQLSDETGGGYDSAAAGAELASFGYEPMDDY